MSMNEALEGFYKDVAYCQECSIDEKTFCPEHSDEWNQWAKHYHEIITTEYQRGKDEK